MKFKLHWLSEKPQIVTGDNIADAMNRAGIGKGALPALDYWEEVKNGDNDNGDEPWH